MKRFLIATLAGGVVFFFWLFVSWTVIDLHSSSFHPLPEPDDVTAALKAKNLETGVYATPYQPDDLADADADEKKAATEKFNEAHEAGPIYKIYYQKEGQPVMGATQFVSAIIIDLLSAGIAAFLLCCTAARLRFYPLRVLAVSLLGLFVAVVGHVNYWVWMQFPLDYTIAMCRDQLIGWVLVALVQAAIIKPPPRK